MEIGGSANAGAEGSLTKDVTKNFATSIKVEAYCRRQKLPGCPCGCIHPLAFRPPWPPDSCPECGRPAAQPGPLLTDEAVIPDAAFAKDRRLRLGMLMMRIGAWLRRRSGGN